MEHLYNSNSFQGSSTFST